MSDRDAFVWLSRRNEVLSLFFDADYRSLCNWFVEEEALAAMQCSMGESMKKWSVRSLAWWRKHRESAPFQVLWKECEAAAEALAQREVVLSFASKDVRAQAMLIGDLLDKKFEGSRSCPPLTSCIVIESGAEQQGGRATLHPRANQYLLSVDVDSNVDLSRSELLEIDGDVDAMCSRGYVTLDNVWEKMFSIGTLPRCIEEADEYLPIVQELKARCNLFGWAEPGIAVQWTTPSLADEDLCRPASVCLGVIAPRSDPPEEVIKWLNHHHAIGGTTAAIVVLTEDNTEDDAVQLVREMAQSCSAEMPIFIVSMGDEDQLAQDVAAILKDEVDVHVGVSPLRAHLIKKIREISKAMMLGYVRAFYQLMHTQYVMLSKLISTAVTKPSRSMSKRRSKDLEERERLVKKMRTEMSALLEHVESELEVMRKDIEVEFCKFVASSGEELRHLAQVLPIERVNGDGEESADDTPSPSAEQSEVDEAPPERKFGATALQRSLMGGLSSIKSMWSSAYEMVGGNGEDFEKKLFERLCRSVLRGFNVHISKWLAARRVKFAGDLVARAAGVEQTAQELQSLLLKDVVALQMCDTFTTTEKKIHRFALQVAAPVMTGVVAGGAGLGGGALLVGLVSTTLLTGGIVLLAGFAITGVAAGIYSLTRIIRQNNMSEEDARARVCEEALKSMHNYSKSAEFASSVVDPAIAPCVQVKEHVVSSIATSLLGVESVVSESWSAPSYEQLCTYMFRRDQISDRLYQLSSCLSAWEQESAPVHSELLQGWITDMQQKWRGAKTRVTWSEHVSASLEPSSGDPRNSFRDVAAADLPQCYACKQRYISCSHLCPACRHALNEMPYSGDDGGDDKVPPCPACSKWKWFAEDDKNLSSIVNLLKSVSTHAMHAQSTVPARSAHVADNDGADSQLATLHPSLHSLLEERYLSVIHEFSKWFIDIHPVGKAHIKAARESVNKFVGAFKRELSQHPLPDPLEELVSGWLSSKLFPLIYERLFSIYKLTYELQDQQLWSQMKLLRGRKPSQYGAEKFWDDHVGVLEAASIVLHEITSLCVPEEKTTRILEVLTMLQRCAAEINMDTLIPVMTFINVHSNMRHLYSEMMYVFDCGEGETEYGMRGFAKVVWCSAVLAMPGDSAHRSKEASSTSIDS